MSLATTAILDAVRSHAAASGYLDRISGHEPKNAPGSGVSAAVWVDRIAPIALASGLAITSALVVLNVRVYTSMLAEPQDEIDPHVIDAVDALMAAYSGNFELGGLVRNVDLLGAHGTPMAAQAGYLNQDGKLYRVVTLTVPLIVNDLWAQVG